MKTLTVPQRTTHSLKTARGMTKSRSIGFRWSDFGRWFGGDRSRCFRWRCGGNGGGGNGDDHGSGGRLTKPARRFVNELHELPRFRFDRFLAPAQPIDDVSTRAFAVMADRAFPRPSLVELQSLVRAFHDDQPQCQWAA